MITLTEVWKQIEIYLDWGLSVIPIRDRDEGNYTAKSPYGHTWKHEVAMDRNKLWAAMEHHATTAVGIVGGQISGNLEIIDLDEKYLPGISAEFLNQLNFLYPEIYCRLRIHGTPSKGFHTFHRCEVPVEGNLKLAKRPASPQEIEAKTAQMIAAGKTGKPQTSYCFIETRGEGGYVAAPPSLNYTIVQDLPIPLLTKEERDAIINLARSFDQSIVVEKPPKPTKQESFYYQENPFDDFNYRCDPSQIMHDNGWEYYKHNAKFTWYTRPGKTKGVSISFNNEKRFFYCFTASSELEPGKGYSPSNLVALLKFNNDKKLLYHDLVSQGYGVINKKVEAQIARKAATNPKIELPANMSAEGMALHASHLATALDKYPHGVFWQDTAMDGIMIDRELMSQVAEGLGFRLFKGVELVRIDNTYIYKVTDRDFFDQMREYIKEDDELLKKDIYNAWEIFIERHGKFSLSRLQPLEREAVLQDTRTDCYKFYNNGILHINATGHRLLGYESTNLLIWKHSVQNRDFLYQHGGKYQDFLELAIGLSVNNQKVIGYLSHQFKDETTGYIIVCTEACANPKEGGGSGKNVFCKLFSHTTTFNGKPGTQVKYDEKFLQSWNGERLFCLSDVPKNFDYSFLKEMSTGEGLMKKLFVNEYSVPVEDMPKFLVQTNYGVNIKDGGVQRRVIMVEFSDFFTKAGGIDVHFGCFFPLGWTEADWAGYDSLIADSVRIWLAGGLKLTPSQASAGMWLKQWQQNYGQVATDFIASNITDWLHSHWLKNEDFATQLQGYYIENATPKPMQPASKRILEAIIEYCDFHEIQFQYNIAFKDGYNTVKGKWFGKKADTPF